MRKITGLNYPYKLEEMIKECCQQALEHPFEKYIFITDDTSVVEQRFFQHIHYLVNIEIITWSQFLKQLQIDLHLTHHRIVSNTELTYHLRNILNQESFECFHSSNPYPLIEEFIPLLKDYELNQIHYQIDQFESMKLNDFIHLYTSVLSCLDETEHLTFESIFDQADFSVLQKSTLFIDADHLYEAKKQDIIHSLSKTHDITMLYTYRNDDRIFNMPYQPLCEDATMLDLPTYLTENLFMQSVSPCQESINAFTFSTPTPAQEINRVVYTIYQKIVDEKLRFQDFVIIYPDNSYHDNLLNTLETLHIPHNLPIIQSHQYDYSYQKIIKALKTMNCFSFHDIAFKLLEEELDKEYIEYLQVLLHYFDEITPSEFLQFFESTYPKQSQKSISNKDHINICTIDQFRVSFPKHIFILGMNETILPHLIKDTSLLLDEDIELLRAKHITTPLTTTERLGVHYNDILKALSQPALSLTISYPKQTLSGEALLPSSLYKQLQTMYSFQELPINEFLPIDEYYLLGGMIPEKETLNQNIQQFIKEKNQPITLSQDCVSQLYSPTLSVSQIETYNKCPFLYFIQYGLGIYPLKEQKLLPNELGSLVHYVLSMNLTQDNDISSLVNHYIQDDENLSQKIQDSRVNQYFIDQLKKDLHITLTVLKRQLNISSFEIHDQEKKVLSDIQGMHFKGFVDRIDSYENYISIIDYKSSAKDIDLNLAMQGFNIQMLLYLKMVIESEEKDPGAVLYFNTKKRILSIDQAMSDPIDEEEFYKQYRYGGYVIDDESHGVIQGLDPTFDKRSDIINVTYVKSRNEYKGQILTKKQLECLLEEIEKHIYNLYQSMMNGNIAITPKGSDQSATHTLVNPCHYCPYHSICGFDVFYNDYEMVQFLDVNNLLGGEEDAV